MAKEAECIPVEVVGTTFGDDIDHATTRAAVLGRVVGPVHLKLADGLLADSGADTAAAIVRFTAIDVHVVSAAIAAVERKAGIRSLLDAIGVGIGVGFGIRYAGSEQRETEVVA